MIEHHPPDDILTDFVAGALDLGQHAAIATHLVSCERCRKFAHALEQVGGAWLSDLAPSEMGREAWMKVEARLDEPSTLAPVNAPVCEDERPEVARLPRFIRAYALGEWRRVAPSVHLRPILLPRPSATRVFLLKSGAGTRMLQHTHTGLEMTCVLTGAFMQDGGHYGPGDFDWGDEAADHRPIVEAEQECVCLVAMQGKLRLKGFLGRLVQPFIRI